MTAQQTSLEAYKSIRKSLPFSYKAVISVFNPKEDLSNTEIASRLGWPINRVTPIVKELRAMGYIYYYKTRKCQITGRMVMTWRLG